MVEGTGRSGTAQHNFLFSSFCSDKACLKRTKLMYNPKAFDLSLNAQIFCISWFRILVRRLTALNHQFYWDILVSVPNAYLKHVLVWDGEQTIFPFTSWMAGCQWLPHQLCKVHATQRNLHNEISYEKSVYIFTVIGHRHIELDDNDDMLYVNKRSADTRDYESINPDYWSKPLLVGHPNLYPWQVARWAWDSVTGCLESDMMWSCEFATCDCYCRDGRELCVNVQWIVSMWFYFCYVCCLRPLIRSSIFWSCSNITWFCS